MTALRKEVEPRPGASAPEHDVIVIGAGMSGLYLIYRLRELGLRLKVFEAGSGVGGTWYWNRYPGARFDSESYSYGYSFSQELLKEWDWGEHFAGQPEVERYCNHVADKFDLRRDIQFSARVQAARYEPEGRLWRVELEDGSRHSARFLVTALGLLSAPTMPHFPGMADFRGQSVHTGLWPKEPVSFAGKRVAVIGTGASGVQAIQEIAKTAARLTVFQRRPNWCTPLNNGPIPPAEMAEIRASYPAIFKRCGETTACFIHMADPRGTFEVSEKERLAFWEEQYAGRGFGIWMGNFRDIMTDRAANRLLSDFVASKIRQRVKDPRVAELLIPKDHGFGTRRVPQETGYYEVYNQPNVELVSMLETPIERIVPTGVRTAAADYDVDIIVYATGFDAITGAFDRIDIEGRDGEKLKAKWQGGPTTFVGVLVDGFPNLFMAMGPHAALGNNPRSIEFNVDWIRDLLAHMARQGLTEAEARPEAVRDWNEFVRLKSEGLLSSEVDSWMTGVNMNVAGKQVRTVVRYNGSAPEYRARCNEVAAGGYREIRFD